ncbi:mechanosensitive ion channel protein MscS [Patiriisocius marinistellae]|uniref:Mechanosensitive ion channel protein MscS n=1 Tax=Patiriisocius marinistellae TaxID=2494560 RepID=A0A5J4G0M8_9FLAO|nr:mechanosensitive ion channel domain-containing protein [Patiriisocius marinistellae]GEQ87288.1 mechanosensitive ion channel protein MscS [Patiriisocius marinistellae]
MINYPKQLLGTLIAIVILLFVSQLAKRVIKRFVKKKAIDPNRKKVILNLSYILFFLITCIVLIFIWGIGLKDFIFFISSILAVLGVGFFAQWSILSNLTSSIILFFNHPVRIGDRIRIVDKDYEWVGVVKDITAFFVYMRTDNNEYISFPNSLVLQKAIEMLDPLVPPPIDDFTETIIDDETKISEIE